MTDTEDLADQCRKTGEELLAACGRVAVASLTLDKARKNQHAEPYAIAPAAQAYRQAEAEMNALVGKLVGLHEQALLKLEGR